MGNINALRIKKLANVVLENEQPLNIYWQQYVVFNIGIDSVGLWDNKNVINVKSSQTVNICKYLNSFRNKSLLKILKVFFLARFLVKIYISVFFILKRKNVSLVAQKLLYSSQIKKFPHKSLGSSVCMAAFCNRDLIWTIPLEIARLS